MYSVGRRILPYLAKSSSTALAVLMGMAKPIPDDWSAPLEAIMVVIPITSPREFNSGPPELPGFTDASVWIASSIRLPFAGLRTDRIAEIMPRVMVPDSPNGLPMAYTRCPNPPPPPVAVPPAGATKGRGAHRLAHAQ